MHTFSLIVTGDISGFTTIPPNQREELIQSATELITSWVDPEYAKIFRGDSFQILFSDPLDALLRSIQLRCWFKMNKRPEKIMLDARMAIGVGEISYFGDSVLTSDGEAFHISGRLFDTMEDDEFIKIGSSDQSLNELLKVICRLMDIIICGWTPSQAEVIFLVIENKTQQQMADELGVVQSAINNRLRLAKWKEIERTIKYISALLEQYDNDRRV